jgi:hypothetical protein
VPVTKAAPVQTDIIKQIEEQNNGKREDKM